MCMQYVCVLVDSDDPTVSFIWHIYFNILWNWKSVGLFQSSNNALLAPVQDTSQISDNALLAPVQNTPQSSDNALLAPVQDTP